MSSERWTVIREEELLALRARLASVEAAWDTHGPTMHRPSLDPNDPGCHENCPACFFGQVVRPT